MSAACGSSSVWRSLRQQGSLQATSEDVAAEERRTAGQAQGHDFRLYSIHTSCEAIYRGRGEAVEGMRRKEPTAAQGEVTALPPGRSPAAGVSMFRGDVKHPNSAVQRPLS